MPCGLDGIWCLWWFRDGALPPAEASVVPEPAVRSDEQFGKTCA